MGEQKNITRARWLVTLTLLSSIGLITIYELGVNIGWYLAFKIIGFAFLLIAFISFPFSFIRTGLWKFTHRRIGNLDEREMQLTGKSLRISYSIFTIMVLVVLYAFALLEIKISVVFAGGLLLLAHMLPGTVVVFSEKELRL